MMKKLQEFLAYDSWLKLTQISNNLYKLIILIEHIKYIIDTFNGIIYKVKGHICLS